MLTAERRPANPPAAPGPPLLCVRRVSVSYGHLRVLVDVDFEVRPGQVVGLVGENGAGKSTLVRCIAGDKPPDLGEVLIEGLPVRSNADSTRSGMAVVWQDLALCDNLDVVANLFLGRENKRWLVADAKARIAGERLLASYGIWVGDVSRPVRSLSSGQRQLVAVAAPCRTTRGY